MLGLPKNYDAWRLSPPDDDYSVGVADGELCQRFAEPDEDAPRGWKPQPCGGIMVSDDANQIVVCDTCGEVAE